MSFDQASYEYPYYSDLVKIKNTNVQILGNIHKAYLNPPSEVSTNPSGSFCPNVEAISLLELWKNLTKYNIIVISSHTDRNFVEKIYSRKAPHSKVAIIDHEDHDTLRAGFNEKDITRDFEKNKHFDIFFKKDLPLDFFQKYIFPLAPDPIRAEAFPNLDFKRFSERTTSVFFSGIVNKPTTFDHRSIILEELKSLSHSSIIRIDVEKHYAKDIGNNSDLFAAIANSKFLICAPGRSWTTTRISMYFKNCFKITCDVRFV